MSELTAKKWRNQQQTPAVSSFRGQKLVILLLVFFLHGVVAWLILLSMNQPRPEPISPPTIQGVMILSEAPPVPIVPPKPVVKPPLPTPVKPVATIPPVKNAPPSEKAITQPEVPETPVKEQPTPQVPVAESTPPIAATPIPTPEPVEEITEPRTDAAYLNNPKNYPPMSRRLGEQGRVLLDVYILANGTVGELRIKQSSGFSRLDQAALRTVKTWRFQPARRGQQAIDFWYVLPLSFSLN